MKRWWKRPRGIVVDGAVWRWSVLDHPQYRELRVYRAAYVIGWHEGQGRREPATYLPRQEPALLEGLLDLFFTPEEQEQREWFLERIQVSPPPCKWEC